MKNCIFNTLKVKFIFIQPLIRIISMVSLSKAVQLYYSPIWRLHIRKKIYIFTVKYFTFLVAITILILNVLIMPSTLYFTLHNKLIHLLCYENGISSCSFTIGDFGSVDKYHKYCMIHTHERIHTGSYIRAQ